MIHRGLPAIRAKRVFNAHYAYVAPHHAALPHVVACTRVSSGQLFGDAGDVRSSARVLFLNHLVGCVPRRHERVLEVQVPAVSTDLLSRLFSALSSPPVNKGKYACESTPQPGLPWRASRLTPIARDREGPRVV